MSYLLNLFRAQPLVRRAGIFFVQLFLFQVAITLAFGLRFDFDLPNGHRVHFLLALALITILKPIVFQFFNLHQGWWRYVSLTDMITIFQATTLSTLLLSAACLGLQVFSGFPRSVLLADYLLTLLFASGIRLIVRAMRERRLSLGSRSRRRKTDRRVLIVGAGSAGIALLRESYDNPSSNINPLGFLDDSPVKWNLRIHGSKVLGPISELPELVHHHSVDEVLIAIPSASKQTLKRIVDTCLHAKVSFRAIPSLAELARGEVTIEQLKEIQVEDLLGRDPVRLDSTHVCREIEKETVLITGAGGSIGSELCRQVLKYKPARLVLYERNENNLFYIERELRSSYPSASIHPVIGCVLNKERLAHVFRAHRPALVYHAAAYKHVPMMEVNAFEAVQNNVFGTRLVAETAEMYDARKFVMISTDKAVNPVNVMGYSKRLAELVVQDMAGGSTQFISVRFGNVLGSSGSVLEIFKKQVRAGGPLTVTHPEAERFFMTIPEAVELVLHAGANGSSGEIYVLDMGESVPIRTLAEKIIQLSDPKGLRGLRIAYVGLRSGEKLREELVWEGEDFIPSAVEGVFVLKNKVKTVKLAQALSELERTMPKSENEIATALRHFVDEIDSQVRGTGPSASSKVVALGLKAKPQGAQA